MKHYVGLEITFDDLKNQFEKYLDEDTNSIFTGFLHFYESGLVFDSDYNKIERSYYQMYNLIKNLVE